MRTGTSKGHHTEPGIRNDRPHTRLSRSAIQRAYCAAGGWRTTTRGSPRRARCHSASHAGRCHGGVHDGRHVSRDTTRRHHGRRDRPTGTGGFPGAACRRPAGHRADACNADLGTLAGRARQARATAGSAAIAVAQLFRPDCGDPQRDDEAEADERRLLEDEQQAFGDDHLLTAKTAQLAEGGFFTTRPLSVPQLQANFAQYLLRKGRAMANEPEPEAALAVFDDLIARFGDDTTPDIREIVADGMHNKALLLEKLDRAPEAVATYDDLIATYHGDELISLRYTVAIAFHNKAVFSMGDPDQALEAAQQALSRYQRLADDKPEEFTEEASKAQAFVDRIRATAPQSMLRHADALAQQGRRAEALAALDRFIDRYGDDSSEQVRPASSSISGSSSDGCAGLIDFPPLFMADFFQKTRSLRLLGARGRAAAGRRAYAVVRVRDRR
jgi:tetratricopeptide (TPR) repeat protein